MWEVNVVYTEGYPAQYMSYNDVITEYVYIINYNQFNGICVYSVIINIITFLCPSISLL